MIYITSGHEKGIGIEVFLKSLINSTGLNLENYHLISSKEQIEEVAQSCGLNIEFRENKIMLNKKSIQTTFLKTEDQIPLSTRTLESALGSITETDILLTLPTKKNQLIYKGIKKKGYTEYLRSYFEEKNLTMNFLAPTDNVLLLTDHIPLSEVEKSITKNLILKKLEITLENFPKNRSIKEVFFSGINPHCGEDGMMGEADTVLLKTIPILKDKYPHIKFHKPKAGDTLYFSHKDDSQLFVFAFHDQGLAPFKLKNRFIGINLTLGLPFKRLSVDHGTAPEIFGKDSANYEGMLYLLNEIEKW